MMNLDGTKTRVDIVTSLLTTFALIIGGCFGAYQYLEKARDDRVKETLNFLDRYNHDPVAQARLQQQKAWDAHFDEEVATNGKDIYAFIRRIIIEEKLESSISVLNDFYAALEICSRNEICDREVALQLFQENACSFFNRHHNFITERRKVSGDSSIGLGTELFAKDPRGATSVSCVKRSVRWYDRLMHS